MRPDTRRLLNRAIVAFAISWAAAVALTFLALFAIRHLVSLWH